MFPLVGMKNFLKNISGKEENGFHELENKFPPATTRSVFMKWFPLVPVTVSASRKELSSKVDGFH